MEHIVNAVLIDSIEVCSRILSLTRRNIHSIIKPLGKEREAVQ